MAATKREWYITGDNDHTDVKNLAWDAETFTIGTVGVDEDFNITSIKMKGAVWLTPPTLYAKIYAVDGAEKPTGAPLSSGSTNPSGWGGTPSWHEISMSAYTLQASTMYALVLRCPGAGAAVVRWRVDTIGGAYAGGNRLHTDDAGEIWHHYPDYDQLFEIWGEPAVSEVELAGVSAIESTTTGALKANKTLVGTSVIKGTIAGTLKAVRPLFGTVVIGSTTTGTLKVPKELIGHVAVESTASGSLTRTGTKELNGLSSIAFDIIAKIRVRGTERLRGVAVLYFIVSGIISVEFAFSNYAEDRLLEHLVGKVAFARPEVYIGLCNAGPTEEATGNNCNEVPNVAGYARVKTIGEDWSNAVAGLIMNIKEFVFPYGVGGEWGVVSHYVLVDSGVYGQGNVLVYDVLHTPRGLDLGGNITFGIGDLSLTLK